jgi:hypothetical protein
MTRLALTLHSSDVMRIYVGYLVICTATIAYRDLLRVCEFNVETWPNVDD